MGLSREVFRKLQAQGEDAAKVDFLSECENESLRRWAADRVRQAEADLRRDRRIEAVRRIEAEGSDVSPQTH